MRAAFLFLSSLVLCMGLGSAFALPQPTGSVTVATNVFYGEMHEFVYQDGRVASRLDWEEHWVPSIEIDAQMELGQWFAAVGFVTAIPSTSGIMEDYDFKEDGNGVNRPYQYSKHTANFENHFELFPKVGYGMPIGESWYVSPSVGLLFRQRKWTATDGFMHYSSTPEQWAEGDYDAQDGASAGPVITYQEEIWAPAVIWSGGVNLRSGFDLSLTGIYYPYLNVTTTDIHISRKTRFYDQMKGGQGYAVSFWTGYSPASAPALAFSLGLGYESIQSAIGTSAQGMVGINGGLTESNIYQSKMESDLAWVTLSASIYIDAL
jgi:outer membrane protease